MVDPAVPAVGGHGLQTSGAGSGAGLTVAALLPVLQLVLATAVVDSEKVNNFQICYLQLSSRKTNGSPLGRDTYLLQPAPRLLPGASALQTAQTGVSVAAASSRSSSLPFFCFSPAESLLSRGTRHGVPCNRRQTDPRLPRSSKRSSQAGDPFRMTLFTSALVIIFGSLLSFSHHLR